MAPRPGLALVEACPPLRAAEAAGLQTAWLKQAAQELPGAAVYLFGGPADALPMLRYFAGPGVELLPFAAAGPTPPTRADLQAVAAELFALGHAPVVVRTADTPDVTAATVLACLAAAATGSVLGCDQYGDAWLCGGPPRDAPAGAAPQAAPWARRVRTADDLELLWHERQRADRTEPPWLPVPDLQAALRWYETVCGAELVADDGVTATLVAPAFRLRLVARGPRHRANGIALETADVAALAATCRSHGAVRDGDGPAPRIGGGIAFTATDAAGNRLVFHGR
ncbi:MAG: hypothetical protein JNL08_14895 [Planctomycetes bacterium]|nr:hypothetical protein [Planctomycetota bacterium]